MSLTPKTLTEGDYILSSLRTVNVSLIQNAIAKFCGEANISLPLDVYDSFKKALLTEESSIGHEVLNQLLKNTIIAKTKKIPLCQDCGLALIFLDLGQNIHLVGGDITKAINKGIKIGYKQAYLRKSICHPLTRTNTGDNTPAVIHIRIIPGDKIHLWLVPKGGGSENVSQVFLLTPAQGIAGIKKQIIQTVENAGANSCPPIILGIAIGSTFEDAGIRAKRLLLRKIGSINPDPEAATLETELLNMINKLGIGPAGLGGHTTCLGVFVDIKPCHIASLPLAINIQCHAARHKGIVL